MKRLLANLVALIALAPTLQAAPTETHVPVSGATVNTLTTVTVTFSEAVVGVEAGDLVINGVPATGVTGSGTTFTFAFTQPGQGTVNLNWDPDNTITDASGVAFVASSPWTYDLVDNVPPVVASTAPAAGETVNALSQAEVTFSKSVNNVVASDLLINGVPATSVQGSGAGVYVFSFPQPADGTVTFSWAQGQAITDTDGNAFAGGSWTSTLNSTLPTPNVIISEFLADNVSYPGKTTMMDEFGDYSPWIELYNKGTTAVNLQGWSLTNDASNPGQWIFPSVTLGAGQYMIVWADGLNITTITGSNHYHTNFTLPWNGGYLALFPPALPRTTPATVFNPYPVQRGDVSYGYDPTGALKYFSTPTFGTANGTSTISGIASAVNYSVNSGYYNFPFNLVISTPDSGVTVRYTTDGSVPTASNGTVYTGPVNISNTTVLRVAAYSATLLSSDTQTETFLFPASLLVQSSTPAGYPITFTGGLANNTWTPTDQTIENGSRNYFQMDQTTVNDSTLYPDGPALTGTTMRTNKQRMLLGFQNIPTVSITMPIADLFDQNTGIYSHPESTGDTWERADSMEVIYPDGSQGNQQVNSGIQIQGGTSRGEGHGFKHSFRLTFKDDYGDTKYSHSIFTDSTVSSFNTFVLDAGSNYWEIYDGGVSATDQRQRGQGMRDAVTADMQNAMGWPSFHSRFVNLFLNGLYWGVDYIHERPDADWAASYYGGDDSLYNVYRNTTSGFEIIDGDTTHADWTSMFSTYITPVCNTNGTIVGTLSSANYQGLQQVLDVTAFADYMIVNLYSGNSDWPAHNWYVNKKTTSDGRFRFVVWDAEYSFLSATTTSEFDNYTSGDGGGGSPGSIWGALRTNPEFKLLVADRIEKYFFNGGIFYVNPASPGYNPALPQNNLPAALYMNRVNEASFAMAGEYSKWGSYTALFAPSGGGGGIYTRNNQWITELNNLLGLQTTSGYTNNFFATRSANVIGYFQSRGLFPATGINAPNYNQFGGRVVPGFKLTAALPTGSTAGGVIYYTTDGSDPRTYGSGTPATAANGGTALLYSSSTGIVLNTTGNVEVKARALYGSTWSAVVDATFAVGSPAVPLRITELMYDPSPGGSSGTDYEFLEIQNVGSQPLDISGYYFSGITYVFPPNTTIGAGSRLVLANNNSPSAWAARYPGVAVAGYYSSSLSNSGERIGIYDSTGRAITSVTYGVAAPWPTAPAGTGPSLEVINPLGDPNDPSNWQASAAANGTPGLPNSTPAVPSVEISEVLAKNVSYPINGVVSDWIELHNTTASDVNIGGWKLSNSSNSYTIPANTIIPAGTYMVVLCTKTNPNNGSLYTNFKISAGVGGDQIELYDNSASPVHMDGIGWGQQIADMSIAKINGVWQLSTPTPGAANTSPVALAPTSELVINEWLTNPLSGASSWFELYNPDPNLPIALQGLYAQTPTQIGCFNTLSFMPPASFLQVFADTTVGGNHLDFSLPTTATTLSLLDPTGSVINTATLDALASNISEGHLPDGASSAAVTFAVSTPGATNAQPSWTGPVWNEAMALDTLDPHPGWVELYNPTGSAYNLGGLKVGNSSSAASAWTIPAGTTIPANGYLVFWCDGTQPASTVTGAGMNTGFSLNGRSGGIYLFNATGQPVNQVQWGFQIPNISIGLVSGTWNLLAAPTPGSANSAAATLGSVSNLRINEWLAAETTGNDWFELYNLDTKPVALAGLYLTDDPSTTGQGMFQIAPLSFIAGNGFVQYQADDSPSSGSDHVNFKLNSSGEYIQISANDGNYTPIDAVSYGIQAPDLSEGRVPDGGSTFETGLTPTPDASNNPAPAVPAIPCIALALLALALYITGSRALPGRRAGGDFKLS